MKLLKTMRLLAVVFFITACAANAQEKTSEGAQKITDMMKEQLKLNNDQYKKVYAVNEDFLKQAKAMKESGAGRKEKVQKFKDIDAKRDEKLKGILSKEQYASFLEHKKENRQKLREYFKDQQG
ncbi:hypothetical protein ACLI1A_03615 [Flavobacterium sp. RHBU_3]|uniref:hypothetical protein n=1 Tax=Flavobacterium sp. RHBU_3 TaxID=3391184 RepID=UPI00398521DC